MSGLNQQILAQVNALEEHFPVADLRYGDVRIWPYIRLLLTRTLWQQHITPGSYSRPVAIVKALERRFRFTGALMPLLSVGYRAKHLLAVRKALAAVHACDAAAEDKRSGNVPVIFLAKNGHRREHVGGRLYNPFYNSLADFMPADAEAPLILEYSDNKQYNIPRYGNSRFIDAELARRAFRQALRGIAAIAKPAVPITGYRDFEKALAAQGIEFPFTAFALREKLDRILAYADYFSELLERHTPRALFLTCFYDDIAFGATLACARAGIPSVELQHGQQGDHHLMYTHWKNVPATGYTLLPAHFWLWGNKSVERIAAWTAPTQRHCAFSGGNAWLSQWLHEGLETDACKTPEFAALFTPGSTNILVALQPTAEPLPDFLIETIVRAPEHYRWYIRMHPRMHNRREEIKKLLAPVAQRVEMEASSRVPLFGLLKRMHYNITLWSTVAYEAQAFGVQTVIIHPTGRSHMADYCRKGIFLYADNTNELLRALSGGHPPAAAGDVYIETDAALIRAGLERVLG